MGEKEAEAVRKVIGSGKLFRYNIGRECERFEKRWAEYLGVRHAALTSSGSTALTAALVGLGVGPGDEVIIPSVTYMATAVAVLAAGAIPVIVDIDDTVTIDPEAVHDAAGKRTKAVIPVHMWGLSCDMDALMKVAKKRNLLVIEDACQAVGGAYEGRMLGSIGHAGAFSFNYYKNISCGEGGALVSDNEKAMRRAGCYIDCCNFYWQGRDPALEHFAAAGARASEVMGAILNVQLGRLPGMIKRMRAEKKKILEGTKKSGLEPIRAASLDYECGTHVMYTLPAPEQADRFADRTGGTVVGKTGRHIYTEWDQVLDHKGAHHPALNPYLLKENAGCRMNYTRDMCAKSLDIADRTVMIATHPEHRAADVKKIITNINDTAAAVLKGASLSAGAEREGSG